MKMILHKIGYDERLKRCSSCRRYLPLTKFGKRNDRWDKKDHICKECRHDWYINNKTELEGDK